MASPEQFGTRFWSFTPTDSSLAVLTNANADFFLEYTAALNGEQVELGLTLNSMWEYTDFTLGTALAQRKVIEDRDRQLKQTYVGMRGTLVTDAAGNSRTQANIMLTDIAVSINDSNQCLEYTVTFKYPLAITGGQMIARALVFGTGGDGSGQPANNFTASNFIVQYDDAGDRTTFKDVFRAAPVRIYSAPALKIIRVTGIYQTPTAAYGSSPLQFRQGAEAVILNWINNKGLERALSIDGVAKGQAHLRNVSIGSLDLPQAVLYDLEFNQGYVN